MNSKNIIRLAAHYFFQQRRYSAVYLQTNVAADVYSDSRARVKKRSPTAAATATATATFIKFCYGFVCSFFFFDHEEAVLYQNSMSTSYIIFCGIRMVSGSVGSWYYRHSPIGDVFEHVGGSARHGQLRSWYQCCSKWSTDRVSAVSGCPSLFLSFVPHLLVVLVFSLFKLQTIFRSSCTSGGRGVKTALTPFDTRLGQENYQHFIISYSISWRTRRTRHCKSYINYKYIIIL